MLKLPVYLDYNATTPCDPRVVDVMLPLFTEHYGNAASRNHLFGWQAEEAVDLAREQVASLIGAQKQEIIFTSGATESDNLALKGVFESYSSKGRHIITAGTEHKAVIDTCRHLEKLGAEITWLPVGSDGLISLAELAQAIRHDTIMIALMYANNETGVVQPVGEIGRLAKERNVIFFTDAAQAIGKLPVNVQDDGIDLMSISAHKLYGPKGVGALYVRRRDPRVKIAAQIDGGGHERGMRSGTLNVPGIAGFGKACEICEQEMDSEVLRLAALRDRLQYGLLTVEESFVNGSQTSRLPHVTNICFPQVESQALLLALSKDLAVSSGSACTSASIEPSYVLKAMGLSDELAHSSLRFACGRFTTEEQVDFAIEKVSKAVRDLRMNLVR